MARLFFGFTHGEIPMTQGQRALYDRRVAELDAANPRARALAALPGAAALFMIPLWISTQKRFALPSNILFQIVFAVCGVVYAVWLIRRRHLRYGPRVLRELGFADVCPHCAYDLSRLPQPEGRCPECGEAFSRFHPAQSDSTGRP